MTPLKDYTGYKVGNLEVLHRGEPKHRSHKTNKWRQTWWCSCKCGSFKLITDTVLCKGIRDEKSNIRIISCGCIKQLPEGEASFNRVYSHYKIGAFKRGYEFNISKEIFKKLTQLNCHYCGINPQNTSHVKQTFGGYTYNGLDRVDNNRGYELNNIVTCCETCNRAKLKMSKKEFLNWIARVYTHSIKT